MARTIHFGVLVWMLIFIAVHTLMIFVTGFVGNVNHITLGTDTRSWTGVALYVAWMVVVVVFWLAASPLTTRHPRAVQKAGRFTVGWLKGLLENTNPTATYDESDISPYFWPNGERPLPRPTHNSRPAVGLITPCGSTVWSRTRWKSPISSCLRMPPGADHAALLYSGLVRHRQVGGCADAGDLRSGPARGQRQVGGVLFVRADGPVGGRYYDCHPIASMYHDLTILAYEMNGAPLNEPHGAPIRLRNEVELGFKQVKWIEAIEFVESFEGLGAGQGGYNEDQEFYGYRMPI